MKMKKRIVPILLLLMLPLAFAFAAGDSKSISLIPGESRIVGLVDFDRLNQKGGFDEENFFKELGERLEGELQQDELENLSELIKESQNLGIDSKSTMYFFMVPEFSVSDSITRAGLIVPIVDEQHVEKMFRDAEMITDETVINSFGEYRYITQKELFVFWNNENLILFGSTGLSPDSEGEVVEKEFEGLFLNKKNNKKLNARKHLRTALKEPADLVVWADAGLFMQEFIKAETGIASIANMETLIATYEELARQYAKMASSNPYEGPKVAEGDLYYYDGSDFVEEGNYGQASQWYKNQAALYRSQVEDYMQKNKKEIARIEKLLKKYQDLNVTFKGNFLNGRIALDLDIYTGSKLRLPAPAKSSANSKLTGFIPGNSLFLVNANIDLEDYYDFINDISFGEMKKSLQGFEKGIESINLTVDEFLGTFTGSLFFSLYDVDSKMEEPRVFFAVEIKNKKRLQSVIDDLTDSKRFSRKNINGLEVYIPEGTEQEDDEVPYIIVKDTILYVVNGRARENLISGEINSISESQGKIHVSYKNSMIGMLDFATLSKMLADSKEDSDEITHKARIFILDRLDNISLNIKTVNPRHLSCVLTIDFVNKEDNSMKQIKNMVLDFLEDELRKKPEDSF